MTTDRSDAMDEARRAAGGGASDRLLEWIAERVGGRSGAQAVFGEPIERGEITVVPVARTRWLFGAGAGSGPVKGAEQGPLSAGSGGGGWAVDDPVGYLEIRPSGAGFRPVSVPYPSPLFLVAGGVAAALVLRALARVVRG